MNLGRPDLDAALRRLGDRARRVSEDDGLATALQVVVDACVDLFEVTGSGVMLVDELNVNSYAAASDGQGRLLETVESATGQGPCTDAFVHDRLVSTDDLAQETRWPEFRAAVAGEPELRAVLGIPIRLGAVPVGTLDVFRDHAHEWSRSEGEAVTRYGSVVQATLAASLAAHTAGERADQLQYALDYRIVIERGVGYLMARDRLDAVTAFNRLRTAARSTRTKIGQVAHQLLDTGELPGGA